MPDTDTEQLTPDEQKRRFAELCERLGGDEAETASKAKPTGKNAKPLTPEEQRRRFEEAARELGCNELEERLNGALDVTGHYKASDAATTPAKGKP